MPKTHLYRVETPSGTITRRTHRTYTHVVVMRDNQHDRVDQRIDERVAQVRRWLADAQALIDGGLPYVRAKIEASERAHQARLGLLFDKRTLTEAEIDARVQATAERMLDDAVVRIRDYTSRLDPKNIEKERAVLHRHAPQHGVIGWCGRLDLAQKLWAKNSLVAPLILEVPQPEGKL